MNPQLTDAGAWWAVQHARDSIVARIALMGYGAGWPDKHVAGAINACNAQA